MTLARSYKLSLLIALYLAQGLPYGFFTLALPVLAGETLRVELQLESGGLAHLSVSR